MMKIALFGTSADPPTVGHKMIIEWLSQNFDKAVVWVSDNPFKYHETSLEQRSIMLSILIKNIESNQNNIYLHQELSSRRTLETVELARKKWNDAEFTLVIGSDLVKQLLSWYQIEKLLQLVFGLKEENLVLICGCVVQMYLILDMLMVFILVVPMFYMYGYIIQVQLGKDSCILIGCLLTQLLGII